MVIKTLVTTALLLMLAACGTYPDIETAPPAVEPDSSGLQLPPRQPANEVPHQSGASAVDQLLDQATMAMADNYMGKASALVERAIRLAPQDPRAYFSLAQIRYHQGQLPQVSPLIQKAKAMANGDSRLLAAISQFQQSVVTQ